jgi:hypothetical protein
MMKTFTAILPRQSSLPPDLSLLITPVTCAEPSAPGEFVGHTEGVLVDGNGHIVAFILRLPEPVVRGGARTLVPAAALRLEPGPVFHLEWTEDQLRAQPRLDVDLQPHNVVDGGPPVESRWMPARPSVVPPAEGVNKAEAAIEAVEGGLIGAAIGAVAGFVIGGPLGAASLAVFFAAGGSLAGLLSGATHDTATEAGELKYDELVQERGPTPPGPLCELEQRLADPEVAASDLVSMTRLTLMTTAQSAPERRNDEGFRRAS